QIVSGRGKAQLISTPGQGAGHWQANLATTDLVANSRGQRGEWRDPVSISAAAHQQAGQLPVVEKLRATASFLELEGGGSLEQFTAAAQCDLGRLESELSRFIDFGKIRLAGRGWTRVGVRKLAEGTMEAVGELQIDQFQLAGLGP